MAELRDIEPYRGSPAFGPSPRSWRPEAIDTVIQQSDVELLPPDRMLMLGRPFTRREASQHGLSKDVLTSLAKGGEIRRVLQGVYVDSAADDNLTMRASALAKVAPDHVVVCDRTAAWLWGADVIGPGFRNVIPPLDVFRVRGHNRLRRVGCRAGTRTLDQRIDLTTVNGVLVTRPLRTALDLGRFLRRDEALAALDALLRVAGLSNDDLSRQLPRFRGQRGVVQLRELVALADPRAESGGESVSRLRLIDGGLPVPQLQWKIRTPFGIVRFRLDMAYPDIKLAIEYDGWEFHSSDDAKARDRRRRHMLRQEGWTFVVLTRDDVYGDAPRAAAKVREARNRLIAAI
jgi:hypothetical protein